jgi:hypothetical protein
MMVEDIVNLMIFVSLLSGNVPQEHQLLMQAVFITQGSSRVHQYVKHSLFIGRVVMGPSLR